MTEAFVVKREIQIAAPLASVFAFLTDPLKIVSWMGLEASTELHPGGLFYLKGVAGDHARAARGAFREVVPVHRLAYSFGWEGGEEVPPGSSLIEIDLIDKDSGTLVRMTHSGLPNAAQCASHDKGWAHYLDRLADAAAGRDPGPDNGPVHKA
ncbi:transcriptional regulator [Bradyrhizobium sp. LTSPM299]|uniref:SRPBCC family protein n=1 Tax=Bradyrhizobium sp. LTSPM299 TaxID=1619233 RepID=UPI0005C96715|nr:SRPBCC family protein [Bradyrhizobium sp. LTSPM299]KJC59127.1 transcriptional regulator [Bradyrhizobium sp. LTSPM299]